MNIGKESESSGQCIATLFNPPAQMSIPPTDDQNIRISRRSTQRFVNFEQRAAAAGASVEEDDARVIQLEPGAEIPNVGHRGGREMGAHRHRNSLDAPGRNPSSRTGLEWFGGRDEVPC